MLLKEKIFFKNETLKMLGKIYLSKKYPSILITYLRNDIKEQVAGFIALDFDASLGV